MKEKQQLPFPWSYLLWKKSKFWRTWRKKIVSKFLHLRKNHFLISMSTFTKASWSDWNNKKHHQIKKNIGVRHVFFPMYFFCHVCPGNFLSKTHKKMGAFDLHGSRNRRQKRNFGPPGRVAPDFTFEVRRCWEIFEVTNLANWANCQVFSLKICPPPKKKQSWEEHRL